MRRIAIVVASKTGQTEKIAQRMAAELRGGGTEVDVFNLLYCFAPSVRDMKSYDAVLIGTPVHVRDFPQQLLDWTWDHFNELDPIPTGLFTVCLEGAGRRPVARQMADKMLRKFIQLADFHPRFVASFGGCLAYSNYTLLKRTIMRSFAAFAGCPTDTTKDHELTNWKEVSQFVRAFMKQDMSSACATKNRLSWTPEPLLPIGLQRIA